MIATELGIRVQFQHRLKAHIVGSQEPYSITTCYLIDSEGINIGVGSAFCVPEDQFVKDVGRRISLTRALSDSGLDKEARRIIWATYLSR